MATRHTAEKTVEKRTSEVIRDAQGNPSVAVLTIRADELRKAGLNPDDVDEVTYVATEVGLRIVTDEEEQQ